jgi:hypothetical protein
MRQINRFSFILAIMFTLVGAFQSTAQAFLSRSYHFDFETKEIIVNLDLATPLRFPLTIPADVFTGSVAVSPDGTLAAYCYTQYFDDGTFRTTIQLEQFDSRIILSTLTFDTARFCSLTRDAFSTDSTEFAFGLVSYGPFDTPIAGVLPWDYMVYNWTSNTFRYLDITQVPADPDGFSYAIQTRILTSAGVIFAASPLYLEGGFQDSNAYYWDFATDTVSATAPIYGRSGLLIMPSGENLYADYDSSLPSTDPMLPYLEPNNIIRQNVGGAVDDVIYFDSTKIVFEIQPGDSLSNLKIVYMTPTLNPDGSVNLNLAIQYLFRDGTVSSSIPVGSDNYPTFLRLIPEENSEIQSPFTPIIPVFTAFSAPTETVIEAIPLGEGGGTMSVVCDGLMNRIPNGGAGQVTPGASNNVRDVPSLRGRDIGDIPAGGIFNVIGEPICSDGYLWLYVDYNGLVGWTPEGQGRTYFTEPSR